MAAFLTSLYDCFWVLWAYFDDLGVDFMVFWGAESISDGFKLIGCQGHVILAKVMVISFKKRIVFIFLHALFFT